MLIKCEHCTEKCKENGGLSDCIAGLPKHEYAYRYRLAEQLHRAVLDRLLDPKNVKKGEFDKDLFYLYSDMRNETHELKKEMYLYEPDKLQCLQGNKQRIIEECGDIAAYLAAIIDTVMEVNND